MPQRVSKDSDLSGPTTGPLNPIARVRVDLSVRHLDRDFDYLVPEEFDEQAVPGARIRVRFAGRLRDAYVLARVARADVADPRPLERVVDVIAPLTAETLQLVEHTAQRYVGSFWDVVRSAVPARHARAERAVMAMPEPDRQQVPVAEPIEGVWNNYRWPQATTSPQRIVWSSAPGSDFIAEIVDLSCGQQRRDRGVVIVVPDAADVERVYARLIAVFGKPEVAVLTADHGPERRYREFLRARTGRARIVVGTRNAVFASVEDMGAIIVWDDGDDVYREPHAPYWDAREVAALRSHLSGLDLFVGAPARSVATQWWCRSGWARDVEPVRPSWWQVQAIDDREVARDPAAGSARIPSAAWQVAQRALAEGPVLFQVMRRGYVPILACRNCRKVATCVRADCAGGLHATSGHAIPTCTRCGALAGGWTCPNCQETRLRAVAVGAGRTAEELGKAFPGVPIVWSQAERIVREVGDEPAVVVATPGAEPIAAHGYAGVVILDARIAPATLTGPEQQVRRWFSAASTVRAGGRVCIVAEPDGSGVQALIRYDSRWFADRQIDERQGVGLPPITRVAELTGPSTGVAQFAQSLHVPHRVLGPVEIDDFSGRRDVRSFVVVDRRYAHTLTAQLEAAMRTASTEEGPTRDVRVRMDPRDM